MDPLNKQERTEAIIKMLALFLLAVIIVAIPMYYAFRLPEKEEVVMKEERKILAAKLAEIEQFEKDFLAKTDSAISLFSAYQKEEDELTRDKIQLRYSNATNQMEDYLNKISDDTVRVQLYDNIIFTFNNLFSAWAEKNELQAQLDDCMKTSKTQSVEIKQEETKSIQEKEIDLINKALAKHNGNKRLAAKELGTTERKLRKRMKELGIN
ncbi:MAG: helix-turn-helix domain-containing protein [Bacteroidota bacterium]